MLAAAWTGMMTDGGAIGGRMGRVIGIWIVVVLASINNAKHGNTCK